MSNSLIQRPKHLEPVCAGAGLIALDIVYSNENKLPSMYAGGTCGNILVNLSFLGWNAYPIARLSNSNLTNVLLKDINRWKVKADLVSVSEKGSTPIIIQRILKGKDGKAKHKFEFKCPICNNWLPAYKPVLMKSVPGIISKLPSSNVFIFDRISPSTLELANYYNSRGALIVFEPSSFNDKDLFARALNVTHVLKFSSDRIIDFEHHFPSPVALLEIETLGERGLRYRLKLSSASNWKHLSAYPIPNFVDTSGAGDWCTTGLIHLLGTSGASSFCSFSIEQIEHALKYGQALASINCYFEGARGLMYSLSLTDTECLIEKLLGSDEIDIQQLVPDKTNSSYIDSICSICI